jgi:RimJ/RimL family protein N-acetyltransferase
METCKSPVTLTRAKQTEWLRTRLAREDPVMLRFEHSDRPSFTAEEEAHWWQDRVESGAFRIWTIRVGQEIAGFVNAFSFTEEPQRTCETGISVFPRFWRRGVATRTYRQLLPILRDQLGVRHTWVGIHPDNVPSLRLYASLGFRRSGILADPPIAWVRMSVDL